MASGAVIQEIPVDPPSDLADLEYNKILKLGEAIYAGVHPRLKVPAQALDKATSRSDQAIVSVGRVANGTTSAHSHSNGHPPPHDFRLRVPAAIPQPNSFLNKPSNSQQMSTSATGSSGLDPIFLTKSDDLVRAEIQLQRQRIERALDEQVQQKRTQFKNRLAEQEDIPDFDVTEALTKAQELVKPLSAAESLGANGKASSSDSFDENTFYSSQMNDSTPDQAARSPDWRSNRPCKYFFEGSCLKGSDCDFSHDSIPRQGHETNKPKAIVSDKIDLGTKANHPSQSVGQRGLHNRSVGQPQPETVTPKNVEKKPDITFQSRNMDAIDAATNLQSRVAYDIDEERAVSPVQERRPHHVGRDGLVERRGGLDHELRGHRAQSERRSPVQVRHAQSEYLPPREMLRSPVHNNMRIVSSNIRSPVAPQPSRVSPLAIAKLPPGQEPQHIIRDRPNQHNARAEEVYVLGSPESSVQPLNRRKRRREPDAHENVRNVVARRYHETPEPYIKEEPRSPSPPSSLYGRRRTTHIGEPQYIDLIPRRGEERVIYKSRIADSSGRHITDQVKPSSPVVRRVVSRTGDRLQEYEEPDLRRIVTSRHIRRPLSPDRLPIYDQTLQPQFSRASPQLEPHVERVMPQQYRVSTQPQVANARSERSLSPRQRPKQYSPVEHDDYVMPPPPRRIVVDKYGNEYYEAPTQSTVRRISVAPTGRQIDLESRQERLTSVTRAAEYPERFDRNYILRNASPGPVSPQYVQYRPIQRGDPLVSRQRDINYENDAYAAHQDGLQILDYPEYRPFGSREEVTRPRDHVTRIQNVRPVSDRYELRDPAPRVASVRPEQDRIVSLNGRREMVAVNRQPSIRAEDRYGRPVAFVRAEDGQHKSPLDVRDAYIGDDDPEEIVYETPRSGGRPRLQRLR